VLNAFRHQRLDHYELLDAANGVLLCSTPFGIRGWITCFWWAVQYRF